jgi:hypothetical protein
MDKFSVAVNESSQYVVSAKNFIGALKSALPVIEASEPDEVGMDIVNIRVSRIMISKKKPS